MNGIRYKKGAVGKVLLIEHFKLNGRKLMHKFAAMQNKTEHFV